VYLPPVSLTLELRIKNLVAVSKFKEDMFTDLPKKTAEQIGHCPI
jgi:hypothetical protein